MYKNVLYFVILSFFLIACVPASNEIGTFHLLEGEQTETDGFVIRGKKKGPLIYVIAGIHGNEPAGIQAALSCKDIKLTQGSLVVLPCANKRACDENVRTLASLGDLNRVFPGLRQGRNVSELAYGIFNNIKEFAPLIVLDLHESKAYGSADVYALGNTLIFSHIEAIEPAEMAIEFLNNRRNKPDYIPLIEAYPGTINKSVSEGLDIPVISFESNSNLPLEQRIEEQKAFISKILNFYSLVEIKN